MKTLLICVLLALASGCAMEHTATMPVRIMVSPPEAEVVIDGAVRGTGPMTVQLTQWYSHNLLARIGTRTAEVTVRSELTSGGEVMLISGFFFIVPWIALGGDSCYQLDPQDVVLIIPPAATEAPPPVAVTL